MRHPSGKTGEGFHPLQFGCFLALYAHHLTQSVDDLNKVLLRLHDSVNRLVGHRGFVNYVRVLAALNTAGSRDVVGHGEPSLGLSAGHRASCAMATAGKTLRVSLTAHDI